MVSLLFGPLHLHQNRARGWFSQSHKQWMDNGMKKTSRNISSAPNVKNVTWKLFLVQRWSPTVFCTKPPRLTNIQWGVCILFLHQWKFRIYHQDYWRHSFTHPRISDWNTHESLIIMEVHSCQYKSQINNHIFQIHQYLIFDYWYTKIDVYFVSYHVM